MTLERKSSTEKTRGYFKVRHVLSFFSLLSRLSCSEVLQPLPHVGTVLLPVTYPSHPRYTPGAYHVRSDTSLLPRILILYNPSNSPELALRGLDFCCGQTLFRAHSLKHPISPLQVISFRLNVCCVSRCPRLFHRTILDHIHVSGFLPSTTLNRPLELSLHCSPSADDSWRSANGLRHLYGTRRCGARLTIGWSFLSLQAARCGKQVSNRI